MKFRVIAFWEGIVATAALTAHPRFGAQNNARMALPFAKALLKGISLALLLGCSTVAMAQTWTPLTHQPTFLNPPSQCAQYPNAMCAPPGQLSYGGVLNLNLLTDGSVLVDDAIAVDDSLNFTFQAWKLTPDIYGSYVNGTWTRVADLPAGYGPFGVSSAVLPDGRVILEGGYFNIPTSTYYTAQGAIYDPVANTWTSVSPPPFFEPLPFVFPTFRGNPVPPLSVGGASSSVVLSDGTFMVSNPFGGNDALLDAKTLTWTQTGAGKSDINFEEGWTLLPNGKVLTVDNYFANTQGGILGAQGGILGTLSVCPFTVCTLAYPSNPTNSELYDPETGTWSSAGSTIVTLTDPYNRNTGAGVLRPDGKVFVAGPGAYATSVYGNTGIYDSKTGKWSKGPKFPLEPDGPNEALLQIGESNGPGALLPNGNVLVAASIPYSPPTHFFEFDGNKLIEEPATPNAPLDLGELNGMLVLPTGQILEMDFTTDVEIYTPANQNYKPSWAPVITHAPDLVRSGGSYLITGIRLSGMSQASMYGNYAQFATNYPLVRITNLITGHVFYSRTHDHSTMAVAAKGLVSTHFDVPKTQELGPSMLEVVTNGIPSKPRFIFVTQSHRPDESDDSDR